MEYGVVYAIPSAVVSQKPRAEPRVASPPVLFSLLVFLSPSTNAVLVIR